MKTHDKDSSGFLDKKEARVFLTELLINLGIQVSFTSDTFEEIYATCDKNGDGRIEKPEIKLILYKMIGKRENEAADKWQGVSEDEQKLRQRIK
jgi:2-phosphoglycerate kinase